MKLVDVAEKQNRMVPVLLTPDVVKATDCILSSLEKIGTDDDNEFFFARISRPNSIDVCIAVAWEELQSALELSDLN